LRSVAEQTAAFELSVAATDLDCREAHLNGALLPVQDEIHNRFLTEQPELAIFLETIS